MKSCRDIRSEIVQKYIIYDPCAFSYKMFVMFNEPKKLFTSIFKYKAIQSLYCFSINPCHVQTVHFGYDVYYYIAWMCEITLYMAEQNVISMWTN
jgi:hypothetical protein